MRISMLLAGTVAFAVGCYESTPFDPSETKCAGGHSYMMVGYWAREVGKVSIPTATSFAFDTSQVCLRFGVEKWSDVPALEAQLRELGVPREAVYIVLDPVTDDSL